VKRRLRDLTLANLDDLPGICRACVFWEVASAPRGPDPRDLERGRTGKEAWWRVTELEWGTPGKAIYDGDSLVGYATFAPAHQLSRARRLSAGVSEDALLLATLWVDPAQQGRGLAKVLLQAVLRETHRRGGRALEAFGDRGSASWPTATCMLPERFLLACGFSIVQDHATHPLLRLDLRQAVRWQESIGHALEGVLSVLARREGVSIPARPALEAVGEACPAASIRP
jgi:GNAT superfamily N-acetyltransferase